MASDTQEQYDCLSCKEQHHPWMDCPKCDYCGEFHCSLNALGHSPTVIIEGESWQS